MSPIIAVSPARRIRRSRSCGEAGVSWCGLLVERGEGAQAAAEAGQQGGGHGGSAEQVPVEDLPAEEGAGRRCQSDNIGGARGVLEQRHLAEELARAELGQRDGGLLGVAHHADPALQDDVEGAPRVVLRDDRRPLGIAADLDPVGDRRARCR